MFLQRQNCALVEVKLFTDRKPKVPQSKVFVGICEEMENTVEKEKNSGH